MVDDGVRTFMCGTDVAAGFISAHWLESVEATQTITTDGMTDSKSCGYGLSTSAKQCGG